MIVTKYPQSCLVLEEDNRRILIDAGTLVTQRFTSDLFQDVEAAVFTHIHADHLDHELVHILLSQGTRVYGNRDVCQAIDGDAVCTSDGVEFEAAGFSLLPLDIPHFPMVNGTEGPHNTGYFVNNALFHPGDGMHAPGVIPEVLALPIAGPSVSLHDAYVFGYSSGAGRLIPIHYDGFPADPDKFAKYCDFAQVTVLGPGRRIEV